MEFAYEAIRRLVCSHESTSTGIREFLIVFTYARAVSHICCMVFVERHDVCVDENLLRMNRFPRVADTESTGWRRLLPDTSVG
jgi:hypothetical protein